MKCLNAAEQQQALDKPIDLFKAIFENEEDSSSEDVSDTNQPPDDKIPHPAAAPGTTPEVPQQQFGQSQQQKESHREVPAVNAKAGQGSMQIPQAQPAFVQTPDGLATEALQQHVFGSSAVPPHQAAAAPQQAHLLLPSTEQPSHPSSSKRRKLRHEGKEKSHKKKSRKEKDKRRSGCACDGVFLITTL